LEGNLEKLFLDMLGLKTEVRVPDASPGAAIVDTNPFRDKAICDPNHLLVVVMKHKPFAEGVAALQAHPAFYY
jgi:uncharacterized protein (DUF1697 family)